MKHLSQELRILFNRLMTYALPSLTTPKVAFQGTLGAYSHMACLEAMPTHAPLSCPDFESAMQAVHDGQANCALLPIDNTIAGRVADIYRLLPVAGLHITAEHFMPVHHCLLGLKGTTRDKIMTVTSHLHALPQCREYINRYGFQKVVHSDTAAAAAEVAAKKDPSWAAIASSLAAELYDLEILDRDIADQTDNTTRFVLMEPQPKWPEVVTSPVMTSLVFTVRSVPAALFKALGGFATNGVNLTKIESYFARGSFDAASFYCEIEGHPDSPEMILALEELQFFAHSVTVLGVYPAHPFRFETRL